MGELSPRLLRRRFWENCQPCYPYLGHYCQHLSKGVLIERGEERELKELRLRVTRLEEENNRLRVITQESQVSLAHLRTLVDHFAQTTLNVHGTEEGIKEEVQRLKRLIDGDPGLGISGLRQDMREARELLNDPRLDIRELRQDLKGTTGKLRADLQKAEERLNALITEKEALINRAKGAWWLAGIAGLTTLANVIAYLRG